MMVCMSWKWIPSRVAGNKFSLLCTELNDNRQGFSALCRCHHRHQEQSIIHKDHSFHFMLTFFLHRTPEITCYDCMMGLRQLKTIELRWAAQLNVCVNHANLFTYHLQSVMIACAMSFFFFLPFFLEYLKYKSDTLLFHRVVSTFGDEDNVWKILKYENMFGDDPINGLNGLAVN